MVHAAGFTSRISPVELPRIIPDTECLKWWLYFSSESLKDIKACIFDVTSLNTSRIFGESPSIRLMLTLHQEFSSLSTETVSSEEDFFLSEISLRFKIIRRA